jgi:hypothetical protein
MMHGNSVGVISGTVAGANRAGEYDDVGSTVRRPLLADAS